MVCAFGSLLLFSFRKLCVLSCRIVPFVPIISSLASSSSSSSVSIDEYNTRYYDYINTAMKHERIPSSSRLELVVWESVVRVDCCVIVEERNAVQRIRHHNDDTVVVIVVVSVLCCVLSTGTFINMYVVAFGTVSWQRRQQQHYGPRLFPSSFFVANGTGFTYI